MDITDICKFRGEKGSQGTGLEQGNEETMTNSNTYGPRMLVEKRSQCWSKEGKATSDTNKEKMQDNIQFQPLETLNEEMGLKRLGHE